MATTTDRKCTRCRNAQGEPTGIVLGGECFLCHGNGTYTVTTFTPAEKAAGHDRLAAINALRAAGINRAAASARIHLEESAPDRHAKLIDSVLSGRTAAVIAALTDYATKEGLRSTVTADRENTMTARLGTCRKCYDDATWQIKSNLNGRVLNLCRTHVDCLMHRIDKGDVSITIAPAGYLPCVAGCFRWIGNSGRAAHQCNAPKRPADHTDRCLETAAASAFENRMVDQPYGPAAIAAGRNLIDADLTDCTCTR